MQMLGEQVNGINCDVGNFAGDVTGRVQGY